MERLHLAYSKPVKMKDHLRFPKDPKSAIQWLRHTTTGK